MNVPSVTVGGHPAQVVYSAQAYAGVAEINIRVPEDVPAGFAAVHLSVGETSSRREAYLEIVR